MLPAGPNAKRILLVEDEDFVREALAVILEAEGFVVAVAASGQEALDYLRKHAHPHLILLDMTLPGMDGREFCDRKRQDAKLAAVPFVLLSGDDRLRHTASTLGAAGFLSKPVEIERLLKVIRRHCSEPLPTVASTTL